MVKNAKCRLCRHEPAQGLVSCTQKRRFTGCRRCEYYGNACQKAKICQHTHCPALSGRHQQPRHLCHLYFSAIRCHQLQCASAISFLLSDPCPQFSQKTIPQNHRDGNFENNFPLLNNIIWELVFFTLLWYHFVLCSEQRYSALCYLLANNGA